jgi:hypothetical protein
VGDRWPADKQEAQGSDPCRGSVPARLLRLHAYRCPRAAAGMRRISTGRWTSFDICALCVKETMSVVEFQSNKHEIPIGLVEALSFVALLYGGIVTATLPWVFTNIYGGSLGGQLLKTTFMALFFLVTLRWLVIQYRPWSTPRSAFAGYMKMGQPYSIRRSRL